MSLTDMLTIRTELPTLKSSMDAYGLRQRTIANNIANSETPGFQSKEVIFEEEFKKALDQTSGALTRTNPTHIPTIPEGLFVKAKVFTPQTNFDNGINSVDIEKEHVDMAKNQLSYDAMTKLTKKHLNLLRAAIKGNGL